MSTEPKPGDVFFSDLGGFWPESLSLGVKQRLCGSGMKWKEQGASVVLTLRALNYSDGRWEQFWEKIDRYGFSLAA